MDTRPAALIAATDETVDADHARLIALWQAAGLHIRPKGRDTLEAFRTQQANGQQSVIGIETMEGQLVGAVITTHDGRKGWINRLAVHPDYRRRGLGLALVTAAETRLKAQGMTVIAAQVEPENPLEQGVLRLFARAGFVEWPGLHYLSKRDSDDS